MPMSQEAEPGSSLRYIVSWLANLHDRPPFLAHDKDSAVICVVAAPGFLAGSQGSCFIQPLCRFEGADLLIPFIAKADLRILTYAFAVRH